MYNVFNMGLGLILIVDKNKVEDAQQIISRNKFKSFIIGEIKKGKKDVKIL